MPKVEISPICLKCQDVREGWTGCDVNCSYSETINAIFELCYNGSHPCRHIEACTQDPRECGYWSHLTYPVEV